MPSTRILLQNTDASGELARSFEALRAENELATDYPADAVADALDALAHVEKPERDETSVPFFTIDPAGSTDLDQALHLERTATGAVLHYAIADVPAFQAAATAAAARANRSFTRTYASHHSRW